MYKMVTTVLGSYKHSKRLLYNINPIKLLVISDESIQDLRTVKLGCLQVSVTTHISYITLEK
jgi:hypothetical protein